MSETTPPNGDGGKLEAQEKKKPDAELIPPQVESVLRQQGVNPEDPDIRMAIEVSMMAWRGALPLPPPPILAEFEKVHPGLTAKMVEWTDEQRAHRKALENKRTDGEEGRKNLAQHYGFVIAIVGVIAGAVVGIWGNAWTGAAITAVCVGGPLAGLALAKTLGINKDKPASPPAPQPPAVKPPGDGAANSR
jgi:uncharacterized membrane protein